MKTLILIMLLTIASTYNKGFGYTKSKLKLTRSHRQTKVTITLKGSPEETQQDLEKIIELANGN